MVSARVDRFEFMLVSPYLSIRSDWATGSRIFANICAPLPCYREGDAPPDTQTATQRQIIHNSMKNLIFTTLIALLTLLSRSAHAQTPQPISDRLDAIVAYPLVISLRVPDENALRRGVTTRIDDGRTFTSTPYWVGRIPYLSLPSWITSYGQWER